MNHSVAGNRLVGAMPKIGIRPAIDGRRGGIRESLEDVTMNMAKAVAEPPEANCATPTDCRWNA